jgi:YidC/Oxa1 family membrane protein insertase
MILSLPNRHGSSAISSELVVSPLLAPQRPMTDIRQTVLWVVLIMSLLMLWDGWQKHNGQASLFGSAKPAATAPAPSSAGSGVPVPAAVSGVAAVPAAAAASAAPAPVAVVSQKLVIETDVMRVSIDTLGGDVVRAELPHYLTSFTPDIFDQLMQTVGLRKKPDFKPEPIVLFDAADSYRAQTGLVGTKGEQLPTHHTLFAVASEERVLKDGANELSLRLESAEQGGVKLVKTFTFKRGAYAIDVKHEVVNTGAAPVAPQLYLQLVRSAASQSGQVPFTPTFTGPALYTDKAKFQKLEFSDIEKGKADFEKSANDGWVAMVQHYFTSAWLNNAEGRREFFVNKVASASPQVGQTFAIGMLYSLPELAPGASVSRVDTLFAGPQEENRLAALAPGLELVKDYGIFSILSKPLFWLLDKLHGLIGNWGWAIVALVVLLKIAFYWLNASAYRSMAKMKAVAPRITEMRERLKDKPQEMQAEMMRIYKEEKVNPVGGCLPIFLQMPFFIALYWVLLSTVEMRQAPWLGWITDLSVRDPFFILPTLMMASSLFQVWLNPPAADPMQQKMMWLMPIIFGFMFYAFPAGLVLYWLTNNLLSIAQQWLINKQLGVN